MREKVKKDLEQQLNMKNVKRIRFFKKTRRKEPQAGEIVGIKTH